MKKYQDAPTVRLTPENNKKCIRIAEHLTKTAKKAEKGLGVKRPKVSKTAVVNMIIGGFREKR